MSTKLPTSPDLSEFREKIKAKLKGNVRAQRYCYEFTDGHKLLTDKIFENIEGLEWMEMVYDFEPTDISKFIKESLK